MRPRLPGLALAGLLSLGTAGALAQAEAERRLDAALDRLRTALGPAAKLEIGSRRFDPVTGRATLSDVVLAEGASRLAIPEVVLTDVSESRIGRAEFARPSYRDGDTRNGEAGRVLVAGMPLPPPGGALDINNLVFEAFELEGFRLQDAEKGDLQLGRLALRDWRPESIGGGTLEGLEFRASGKDMANARLGRVALEGVVLPRSPGAFDPVAFRAGRLAIEGAEVRDPGKQVTASLGRLALRDWVPGRLTELAVEGLSMSAPASGFGQGDVVVGRLAASGIDAAGVLEAVMENRQVPDPRPGTPQRIALEGVQVGAGGQPVFALGRLALDGALEGGIGSGGMVAEGLRILPPAGTAPWLDTLGYREIAGRIESRASAPRAGGTLEVAPLAIAWDGAGALALTARLDGMPAAPPEGAPLDQDGMVAQFAAARLAGLTLSWREQGLLGRFLAQQAREQRVPEARLREQWAQMALALPIPGEAPRAARGGPPVKGGAAAAPASPDAFAPMRQAIAAFIRQPGTLEVTLAPPKPVPLSDLAGFAGQPPAQAVRLLGLSVTAR